MRVVARLSSIVAVSVIGTVLVVAGVVMLITPGPGVLAIIAGLAVWSREFRWARGLLDRARARVMHRMGRRGDAGVAVLPSPGPDVPDGDVPRQRVA